MISGAHIIIYSKKAEADRAFFRDVLRFPCIDAGEGWLIFALPPAEAAFHPSKSNGPHEMYLTCPDLKREISALAKRGVRCSRVKKTSWGQVTTIRLPGGGKIGLYQPRHPQALDLASI